MILSRSFKCASGAVITTTNIGFGSAPIGNLFQAIPDEVVTATLEAAWNCGMRVYDTAPLYGLGLAEERTGRFLAGKPRDEFVLSTKIGRILIDCPPDQATPDKFVDVPSRRFDFDYSYAGVMRSLEDSLKRIGTDRVDILLCHDVDVYMQGSREASDRRVEEFMNGGYHAMIALRDQGVIKAIGAGINEWEVAETLARRGDFDIFLLAGRYTLLEQEALTSFLPLCEQRGIGILLGGPYNSGILATGARPGAIYNYAPAPTHVLARVARIEAICAAHGVPIAAAALQFGISHPAMVSVIPGAKSPQEVAMTVATLEVAIPAALWVDLRAAGLLRDDAPVPA